jgi:MFS family permease
MHFVYSYRNLREAGKMTSQAPHAQHRVAGWLTLVATITMATGAVVGAVFGTFVDEALEQGTFAEYLTNAAANNSAARANLWLWIIGVIGIGIGGVLLSQLGSQDSLATRVARFTFVATPAAAIVFYSMLLGVVVELAPRHVEGESVEATARAIAYIGTTADWIATALMLGLGIATLAYAGKDTWVPRWLYSWALATAGVGVVSMIGTITGARSTVSFVILPVAMTWLLAAGITAVRHVPESVSKDQTDG